MSTEVIDSYNIYVDTERMMNSTSNGNEIMLSLNQTPITCDSNQFIRLTLQSFSMYKSFTNCNANNNIFNFSGVTTHAGALSYPATEPAGTSVDYPMYLAPADYQPGNAGRNELASDFANRLASALSVQCNQALAATPIDPNTLYPKTGSGGENIISFRIDFAAAHSFTSLQVRTLVQNGDCFELLGTNRIRAAPPTGTAAYTAWTKLTSCSVDLAPASAPIPGASILITCPYNCQLSTQQNVYLQSDISGTNIQTESFASGNTDTPGVNQMSASRILGRMTVQDSFVDYTSQTQMEYFVSVSSKQITFLRLRIVDSHGRVIPPGIRTIASSTPATLTSPYDSAGILEPGGNSPVIQNGLTNPDISLFSESTQAQFGNRSWEGVVKVDILQHMSLPNNTLETAPIVHTVPARFGTEPLNKLNYGKSGYSAPRK